MSDFSDNPKVPRVVRRRDGGTASSAACRKKALNAFAEQTGGDELH